MFRWCSYCQHLIGEAEPYEDYSLTHGICADCGARLEKDDSIQPGVLEARRLMDQLLGAGRLGKLELDSFVKEAVGAGLRSSDVLIGLIQPALYEIGRRWEQGKITVADEHRFTDFCRKVYERLPRPPHTTGPVAVLLALAPGNQHDLGVRILDLLAAERGIASRVVPTGSDADAIVAAVARDKPRLFGLSIRSADAVAPISAIVARCKEVSPGSRLALGGMGAHELGSSLLPGITRVRGVDDYYALLDTIAKS